MGSIKWNRIVIALIVVLAAVFAAVAYPEFKGKDEPTTTTTVSTTAPFTTDYTPVQCFRGYLGPEHHQWDYYYEYDAKKIHVEDRYLSYESGWGDSYAVDYAGAPDGLLWDAALKDYPLIAMTFSGLEGVCDELLFAYHPQILAGKFDLLTVKGVGSLYYEDGTSTAYGKNTTYDFKVEKGRLLSYSKGSLERTTYTYDGQGRIIRINKYLTHKNGDEEETLPYEIAIEYPDEHTIRIDSNWHATRRWEAKVEGNTVTELKFTETDDDSLEEDAELEDISLTYDEDGYLTDVEGPRWSIFYDIPAHITYEEDHLPSGFGDCEYLYGHPTPEYETTVTTTTTTAAPTTTTTTSATASSTGTTREEPATPTVAPSDD